MDALPLPIANYFNGRVRRSRKARRNANPDNGIGQKTMEALSGLKINANGDPLKVSTTATLRISL